MKRIVFGYIFILSITMACEQPPVETPSPKTTVQNSMDSISDHESPTLSQPIRTDNPPPPNVTTSTTQRKTCMHLKLQGMVQEVKNELPFMPKQIPLPSLLKQLRDFTTDDKIAAIFLEDRGILASLAQLWEIRKALLKLKKSGKQILYYADSYDTRNYYLASAANTVILNEAGAWEVTGIAMEFTFLKDALAMLGIQADFLQVGKYKGAAENLTRNSMSTELRENLTVLLDSLYDTWIVDISTERGLKESNIRAAVDEGIISPENALQKRLIDRVADISQEFDSLRKQFDVQVPEKPQKTMPNLLEMLNPRPSDKEPDYPHIALVMLTGPIVYAADEVGVWGEDITIDTQKWLKTLEKIQQNPHVKGILLRIDSPGGSALASDILWKALQNAAGDRPMVVSMGSVAASGGYYIASSAQTIFASPFTLTGSIGVVGGKIVFQNTLSKLKIGSEILNRGQNAAYLSSAQPFSPSERTMIMRSMERTYQLFLQRIRTTRAHLKNLENLAQGRIWSGANAQKNGLVDQIGGLQDAAAQLRKQARLAEDIPVLIYPRPKPWLLQLQELLDPDAMVKVLVHRTLKTVWGHTPWHWAQHILHLFAREHVQLMPPAIVAVP